MKMHSGGNEMLATCSKEPRGTSSEGQAGKTVSARNRRVLFVSYEFPPSMEMGAHAVAQIARYLPVYRWEVTVLTVQERYIEHRGSWPEAAFPGHVVRANVLPHPVSFLKWLMSKVRRSADGPRDDGGTSAMASGGEIGILRRWVLSLLLIVDWYTGWIVPASVAGLKVIRQESVDHLLSSGPPFTSHMVGLVLSIMTRLPWSAHFRDPWMQGQQCKPTSAAARWIDEAMRS